MTHDLVPLGAPDGRERWTLTHGDRSFAVFLTPEGPVVTDALCPHRQAPLVGGVLRDGAVVCPGHWYTFDLGTGECRSTDAYRLARYRVVEVDGAAYAEVPPPAPRLSWSERLRAHAAGE